MTTEKNGAYPEHNQHGLCSDQPPPYLSTENHPQLAGGLPPASGYQPAPVGYNPSVPEIMVLPIAPQPQPSPALLPRNNECPDPDNSNAKDIRFSDLTVRREFMRRVYTILLIQISIMIVIIICIIANCGERHSFLYNAEFILGVFGFLLFSSIFLACCGEWRRKHPINYIYLFIYSLAESFLLASVIGFPDSRVPHNIGFILIVAIIGVVYLGLTIFAFQTKYEYTTFRGLLFVVFPILLVLIVLSASFGLDILVLLYMSLILILYSVFLVCETGKMLEGNHRFSLAPDDFVFAALILHIGILNIFVYILSVLGKWLKISN